MNLAPIFPQRRAEPTTDPVWAAELKLDGFRGIGDTIRGKMLSKNLNPLKRFPCSMGRFAFSIRMADRTSMPCYSVEGGRSMWCLLFYEGEDIRSLPLKERRAILDQVAERYELQKSELFLGCTKKLYEICSMDLEGLVLKKLDDAYDSERTKWWKVLNPEYSQKIDRGELFERRAG
jgi:ATP-dependent DNA ligase